MNKLLSNKYFLLTLRIILGAVFIYASVGKIFQPEAFAKAIKNYEMLPLFSINILAIILPYLEFITGILLIAGIFKHGSSLVAIVSLIVFLIALVSAYARGLNINCGCFSLESASSKSDILMRIFQDVLMLLASVTVYIFTNVNKPALENQINENKGE